MTTETPTNPASYELAFNSERMNEYPPVDEFEERMGYALERSRLENAARVLACPLKKNPPNWVHGRVLYSLARNYLQGQIDVSILDIGSAKGFSALCLLWALRDSDILGSVTSVDVIDPEARVRRNTVAELDGYKSFCEYRDNEATLRGNKEVSREDWLEAKRRQIWLRIKRRQNERRLPSRYSPTPSILRYR